MTKEVYVDGPWFKDKMGRTLVLRGVNLGGSSKLPYKPYGRSHDRATFLSTNEISFVGRPFPLKDAREHFSRLKQWGFNIVRLLVTWEAVEHEGPGIYDEEFLRYLFEIARLAGEYEINIFIDPHQDTWSRMTGGDGAPVWTLDALGLDPDKFSDTGTAVLHCIHGDPYPPMLWTTNYNKFVTNMMFTLFFGGNDFAPNTFVKDEPVQEFLQGHYIRTVKRIAQCLKGLPNVIGYDIINEPWPGYIGWESLTNSGQPKLGRHLEATPTPFQAMQLASGFPQEVENWGSSIFGPVRKGTRLLNLDRNTIWKKGYDCIWKQNGVWELDHSGKPYLKHPDYFTKINERKVNFAQDYLRPFINRYIREINSIDPEATIFIEGGIWRLHSESSGIESKNIASSPHWYDGLPLYTKKYFPFFTINFYNGKFVFGRSRVQQSYNDQLAGLVVHTKEALGDIQTLIGEFGIPFDMWNKRAYRTGNFASQETAMNGCFQAMDENLLSCTLWNYNPDNDNDRGDQWNGEDFSIFSYDQQSNPENINSGGRALKTVVRPYAQKVSGHPIRMHFDPNLHSFEFAFRHDANNLAPTQFFVPTYHYPDGCIVKVSDGKYQYDKANQTLTYWHTQNPKTHTVRILRQ